jgi:hypothetical protein
MDKTPPSFCPAQREKVPCFPAKAEMTPRAGGWVLTRKIVFRIFRDATNLNRLAVKTLRQNATNLQRTKPMASV